MPTFTIELDRENRTYEPGDKIVAKIEVMFDQPVMVRCIAVRFHGFASTEWTKVKSNKGRKRIKTYAAFEEYFRTYNDLSGEREGPAVEFPVGRHIFPVEYTLPFSLPSSFQGQFGAVKYTIKAKIDADGIDQINKSLKEEFYIVSPLDLNLYPESREQKKHEEVKYFCCFCCRSGPITVTTTVPRTGYIPGEKINFLVEVDNTSRIDVLSVKVFLKEIQTFRSTIPKENTKITEELVSEVEFDGTKNHDSKNYKGELSIPSEKVKNLKNCTLIDVDYEVFVIAEVNKLHMDIENRLPIMIGSIPFSSTPSDVIMSGQKPKAKSGSIPFIDSTE